MELTLYQLDAFSSQLFGGNPAAVIPLKAWLPDALMQQIAMENNLPETAFFVKEEGAYRIRWFTPVNEVKLCGHATLASAWVYFQKIDPAATQVSFNSLSGPLHILREGAMLTLDFPATHTAQTEPPAALLKVLGTTPQCCYVADDWMVRLNSEEAVRTLQPDMQQLRQLDQRGLIVTAEGSDCDFVSRFFAPKYGIDEDPVTGSAHTKLTPYWASQLGKKKMLAKQLSSRGGQLVCEMKGERVFISGEVTPYLKGVITL